MRKVKHPIIRRLNPLKYTTLSYVAVLFIIGLFIYHRWLIINHVFSFSDYGFSFHDSLERYLNVSLWDGASSLGSLDQVLWRLPINLLLAVTSMITGTDLNVSDKFIVLWPAIIVSFLPMFLLAKKITSSNLAGFVAAIIFAYNTYFLAINTQGQIYIQVASGLAVLAFYLFYKALEEKKKHLLFASAILNAIAGFYDLRVLYIFLAVLAFFVIYRLYFRTYAASDISISDLCKYFGIILLLNIFWILPTFTGAGFSEGTLDRSLFGSNFWSLLNAITLHHPFWSNTNIVWFTTNGIPFYFFLIPFAAFLSLYLNRKNNIIVFFGFVALVAIFLTKQIDQPLRGVYPWLHRFFPGFSAFREASKFYILIAFSYSILIGALVGWINNQKFGTNKEYLSKILSCLTAGIFIIIFMYNTNTIVNGKIGQFYTPTGIPNDYIKFKNYISKDSGYFRTYWIPTSSRWAYFSDQHPKINAATLISKPNNIFSPNQNTHRDQILATLTVPFAQEFLESANIKYIIIPQRDHSSTFDAFTYYGDDRQSFIDSLNNIPWLKKSNVGTKQLVVYENKKYNPYIFVSANTDIIPTKDSLANYYLFSKDQLKEQALNFTIRDKTVKMPARGLKDIFANLQTDDFHKNIITSELSYISNGKQTLYANTNNQTLSYSLNKGSFTLYRSNINRLFINNSAVGTDAPIQSLKILKLQVGHNYYVGQIPDLIPITNGNHNIGRISALYLFDGNNQNMILNASLESGLWLKNVQDCNNYDNKAVISMGIDRSSHTAGKQSLSLSALNHTACTGPLPIKVSSGGYYHFGFDYKVAGTNEAGYQIAFDDPANTTIKYRLPVKDSNWRQFSDSIKVPSGASNLTLKVMGFPDERRHVRAYTNYDNFVLEPLASLAQINANTTPLYQQVHVNTKDKIEYRDSSYSFANLLPNASFENGLWQKKVGDCNNYDSHPILRMTTDQKAATNGKNSLQLEATKHTACTSNSADIAENNHYFVSFDYQSPNNTNAAYTISFNDPANTIYSESLPITDSTWRTFTKTLKAPTGGTKMTITVYGYPNNSGAKRIITRYDNFQVIKIPDIENTYYLVRNPDHNLRTPAKVAYTWINPTKKLIHIKSATTPFFLNMSENYHPKWQLEMYNNKVQGLLNSWIPWIRPDTVPDSSHYKLDDFANGWYVDVHRLCKQENLCKKNSDGSYNMDMVIEFTPQRWFYIGSVITGVTFVSCLGYLVYSYRRGKDKKVYRPR